MNIIRRQIHVVLVVSLINSVIRSSVQSITSYSAILTGLQSSYIFVAADDYTINTSVLLSQVKGEEKVSRELANKTNAKKKRIVKGSNQNKKRTNASTTKKRNSSTTKKRSTSTTKKRSNSTAKNRTSSTAKKRTITQKKNSSNGSSKMRVQAAKMTQSGQNKKRGAIKRGRTSRKNEKEKNTRTSGSYKTKTTPKKTRYGATSVKVNTHHAAKKPNEYALNTAGTTYVSSSSASGLLFYPNFAKMVCTSDGMAPRYFPPTFFSPSIQDCCAANFPTMIVDCVVYSSGDLSGVDVSDVDLSGGIVVVTTETSGSSGKSGKSGNGYAGSSILGGGTWMGTSGKAGKAGGKSGKSGAWWGGSHYMGPILGWGGGYSEEPTYFPSYLPTYLPTTYIPTYYPTEIEKADMPEKPQKPGSGESGSGEGKIPTYFPTLSSGSGWPTYYPTYSTYEPTYLEDSDDEEIKFDDDNAGGKERSLYTGSGDGTYYYDVSGKFCPQDDEPYAENEGYPTCTSFDKNKWKNLQDYDTNNIVAIDRQLLADEAGRKKYCGKEIKVYKDGELVKGGPFVVFDGCEACEGGVRIDFSLSALDKIDNGNACENGVVPGISWDVVDNQIINFVP